MTLLLSAPSASAHTELESSSPKGGAHLARTPRTVTLVFSERVDPADVHVTAHGKWLPVEPAGSGEPGSGVVVRVPNGSGDARLNLNWQVRDMEDGHPTSGTLTFRIGKN
ncbi:copper resistance protein CopC, partial [Streptomyces sp. NPDC056728]